MHTRGERIYQDYFGDFFLRVILRFIFQLETILKTIYSENSCQTENTRIMLNKGIQPIWVLEIQGFFGFFSTHGPYIHP